MSNRNFRIITAAGLITGAVLGMAGTFAPTPDLRSLAWGLDGTALVIASALLAVHYLRQGYDQVAAGFLVFLAGQTLIVSGAALNLEASSASFAAGAGLWAAGIALISAPTVLPRFVRLTGAIAAILLAVTAIQLFAGGALTPLARPLPFGAYPFLAATLFGWAWAQVRPARGSAQPGAENTHAVHARSYDELSLISRTRAVRAKRS